MIAFTKFFLDKKTIMFRIFQSPEPSPEKVKDVMMKFCSTLDKCDLGHEIFFPTEMFSREEKRILKDLFQFAKIPLMCRMEKGYPSNPTGWAHWYIQLSKNAFIATIEEAFAKRYPEYYKRTVDLPAPPAYKM
jgi:hypothetical protein